MRFVEPGDEGVANTPMRRRRLHLPANDMDSAEPGGHFPLASRHFALQSRTMKTDQAAEQLQTIRTLMERSALYRRALAPLMTFAGGLGIIAATLGYLFRVEEMSGFIAYWFAVALTGLAGSLLLVRRQAIKTSEPFWSPPTKRVAQAMLPTLTVGFLCGVFAVFLLSTDTSLADMPTGEFDDARDLGWLAAVWAILYGCGLHAAGFFTSRGLRHFGWLFIAAGNAVFCWMLWNQHDRTPSHVWWHSHVLMGALFGGLQLAYGLYLYATGEEQNEL
jgi:hypothetical protein